MHDYVLHPVHFGLAPLYITELVSTVAAQTSRPGLRSADTTNYVQPLTRLTFSSLLLVDFIFRFLITYFDICTAPMFLFL